MTQSALGLCRELRRSGISVPISSTLAFHAALVRLSGETGLVREDLYWAGRSTLVLRRDQIADYDRVFAAYFDALGDRPTMELLAEELVGLEVDGLGDDDADGAVDGEPDAALDRSVRFSSVEQLRDLDLATLTEDERREAFRAIAMMRIAHPRRPAGPRRERSLHGRIDLRSTVRLATRADGEMMDLRHRTRRRRARRVVILADVSGSMSEYSRAMLRFAHCVSRSGVPTEVFALGTRVTRLSRSMSERDPDLAVRRACDQVTDWAGGTRLGQGLRTFCDGWGQRGVARGAIVVILSDGWDRGEPELLDAQMRRLSLLAHRIVWVNPLKASPDYAPIAVGMAAALPYCDRFMEGHSLRSLEALTESICEEAPR